MKSDPSVQQRKTAGQSVRLPRFFRQTARSVHGKPEKPVIWFYRLWRTVRRQTVSKLWLLLFSVHCSGGEDQE